MQTVGGCDNPFKEIKPYMCRTRNHETSSKLPKLNILILNRKRGNVAADSAESVSYSFPVQPGGVLM